jgi:hypothetical protein
MLSARTIFFTPSTLKFECRTHSVWEGSGAGVTGPSWSARLDDVSPETWRSFVTEYTRRGITRASDRLPAVEAVVRRISRAQGWTPAWGMWVGGPVGDLLWMAERARNVPYDIICRTQPGFYAPSWSWASLNGAVAYDPSDHPADELEIKTWDTTRGVLTVAGRAFSTQLTCTVDEYHHPVSGETLCHYDYSLAGDGIVAADCPLKPWTSTVEGPAESTVIRVPHGESRPKASWTSNCVCLRVGTQGLMANALVLGRSPRVHGAWERVGRPLGLDPAVFSQSETKVFDIA